MLPKDISVAPQLTRWDLRGDKWQSSRSTAPLNAGTWPWKLGDKWWGGPGPGNLGIFGWFRWGSEAANLTFKLAIFLLRVIH